MLSVYFCCAVISQKKTSSGSSTTTSSISSRAMDNILQQLKQMRHRDSTCSNYYGIWKNFNKFILRLDIKPTNWEDRLVMYVAYLIHMKRCSTTIKRALHICNQSGFVQQGHCYQRGHRTVSHAYPGMSFAQ